ncbi:wax ester/triacylglycerol synthase family O-acyltransferase [Ideonella sp. A 288]|uniref:wax ester/triacylglycerol synthase family O-acyltransferase n=1 Tax=Ideonella sp. A 288 TaxID=1962181 RepID=UPI000B4A61A2|nr:wax ester/triacylglycerol synthase family O-acyltransferase [Ideonella sp. A 288]
MKQLSGLDATFLFLETPEMPMHVGALNIYELPAGHKGKFITQLRKHMAERMPLMPVLRRRVWWMPLNLANPAWVDAEPDLRHHIVEHKLPPSAKVGDGMAELEAAVSELHAQRLDRARPLWKFHVLEGLAPTADGRKRVALYSQFHHAAVDGQAAVALARVILDLSPEGRALDIKPSKRPRTLSLSLSQMLRGALASEVSQVVGIVKQLPSTVGTLSDAAGSALRRSGLLAKATGKSKAGPSVSNLTLAPRTVFNQSIGAGRAFAGVSLPLGEIKALGKQHQATINDVVLLVCSTALRRYLQQHKALPRKSLVAAVPISLREKGDTTSDNQASMTLVSLGTNIADLGKRLAHVKAATAAMKSTVGDLRSILPTDFPSIGVPWLMEAVTALYGKAKVADRIPQVANVVISNVPGPPVPLFLAGARMACNYPTSIVVHGIALNITVESYDQQMDFGLVADAHAMPDVRALAKAIEIAFDDLRLLSGEAPPDETAASLAAGVIGAAQRKVKATVAGAVQRAARTAVDTAVGQAVGAVARATGRSKVTAPIQRRRTR